MTPELPAFDHDVWRQRLRAWQPAALPDDGRRRAAVALPLTEAGFGADLDDMPEHADWHPDPALLLTRRAGLYTSLLYL